MTYYAAFAEEFKSIGAKSRLALSGQDLRDFATSPFFRTVRGFYQYRVCAAGYMSVVLVVSLVFCIFDMDGSINLYLIYYTWESDYGGRKSESTGIIAILFDAQGGS